MQERIEELRRQVRVLEWDKDHNQLNINKTVYLTHLKEELASLEQQSNALLPQEENPEEILEKDL